MDSPIKKAIDNKNLTYEMASKLCGMSPSTIARHVSGDRGISLEHAWAYNKMMRVKLEDMVAWNRLLRSRKETSNSSYTADG